MAASPVTVSFGIQKSKVDLSSTCETPTMSIPLFHSQKFSIAMCLTYTAAGTGTVKSCASSSANHLAPHNNAKDVRSQSCYANKRRLVSIVSESAFGINISTRNTPESSGHTRPSLTTEPQSDYKNEECWQFEACAYQILCKRLHGLCSCNSQ